MKSGSNIVLDPSITSPDAYVPPTTSSTGSGFFPYNPDRSLSADFGTQLKLTMGSHTDFQFGAGWFGALSLNGTGAAVYGSNIKGCVGMTYQIGDVLEFDNQPGLMVGPSSQAVESDADSLINQDPTAVWDTTLNGGKGGVAGSAFNLSPRIVAVPLVNPEEVVLANQNGRTTVPISNIMGFFVEGWDNSAKAVVGRLMTTAGLMTVGSGGTSIGGQSSFLRQSS